MFGISGCVAGLLSTRWGGGRQGPPWTEIVFCCCQHQDAPRSKPWPQYAPRAKHLALPLPFPQEPEIYKKRFLVFSPNEADMNNSWLHIKQQCMNMSPPCQVSVPQLSGSWRPSGLRLVDAQILGPLALGLGRGSRPEKGVTIGVVPAGALVPGLGPRA